MSSELDSLPLSAPLPLEDIEEDHTMALLLIADDEPLVRSTLCGILRRAGYDVIEAEDGDQVLEACATKHPDLVLIDIIMPNREGIETIAALREVYRDLPIVAMSGGGRTGSTTFLDYSGRVGANRMLMKPMRNADLLEAVAGCLVSARAVSDAA
jgi:CheY-like chemotaxis protein